MRIAHQFRRYDVDAFMNEIDHDQFQEWRHFFSIEPQGWQATALMIQRLSWSIFQVQSKEKIKESDFAMKLGRRDDSIKMQRIRLEAGTIKANVTHERKRRRKRMKELPPPPQK